LALKDKVAKPEAKGQADDVLSEEMEVRDQYCTVRNLDTEQRSQWGRESQSPNLISVGIKFA